MSNSVFIIGDSVKPYFALIIFIISLFLICVKIKYINIGRAGYSLIGATLMVMFNIVPPNEIGSVVNWDTLILLMSMMMLSNYMEKANIWSLASNLLLYKCKSPFTFLIRVCIISSVMSSILTNDTVCVTITPIVIKACESTNLPFFPYLMAIATSANIGSASLPVGNPQNMIIATAGGLEFINFFKVSIVSSLLGVVINSTLLYFYFKKNLNKYEITVDLNIIKDHQLESSDIKKDNQLNYNKLINDNNSNNNNSSSSDNCSNSIQINNNKDNIIDSYNQDDNNNNNIIITSTPNNDDNDNNQLLDDIDIDIDIDNNNDINNNNNNNKQYNNKIKIIINQLIKHRVSIILFLILVGFFIGLHMGFTVMFGVSILMMIEHKNDIGEIIKSVDWELLLFFSGLFILVDGFDRQFAKEAWTVLEPFVPLDDKSINIFKVFIFSIMVLILSNILGNVPLVLSLCPRLLDASVPNFTWLLLAFVSTVAGNLTLVGSVANLIVAEKSKSHHVIGFLEYLKFGVPSTILVILIGVPIVVLMSKI